jgi:hypothetical protein
LTAAAAAVNIRYARIPHEYLLKVSSSNTRPHVSHTMS